MRAELRLRHGTHQFGMDLSIVLLIADQKITRKRNSAFTGMLSKQHMPEAPIRLGITHVDIHKCQAQLGSHFRVDGGHALAGMAIMSAKLEKRKHRNSNSWECYRRYQDLHSARDESGESAAGKAVICSCRQG